MSQPKQSAAAKIDNAEPTAGMGIVPVWLVVFLGVLLFWAMIYLDGHSGGFNQEVFEPYDSIADVTAKQPYDPVASQLAMGKDVFDHTCTTCHQPNGMGKEGQFPPLVDSNWLLAATPTRIGRIVLNGLSGNIIVEAGGKKINLNATMAPLGDNYDDAHLAAALTYVRSQWGNHASAITADQIKAIRAASASKHNAWSPDDLLKMPLTDPTAK